MGRPISMLSTADRQVLTDALRQYIAQLPITGRLTDHGLHAKELLDLFESKELRLLPPEPRRFRRELLLVLVPGMVFLGLGGGWALWGILHAFGLR